MHENGIFHTREFWICAALFFAFIVVQIVRYLKWRTAFILDRAHQFVQDNREDYEKYLAGELTQADVAELRAGLELDRNAEPIEIIFIDGPQESKRAGPEGDAIAYEWREPLTRDARGNPRGFAIYHLCYKLHGYEGVEDE